MSRLTQLAISQRSVTLLLAFALFIAGISAWGSLKQELLPDVDFPVITVVAPFPGAGATDVAKQVAEPIERSIQSIPGLAGLRSTSANSIALVVAQFEFGTNVKETQATIEQNVAALGLPASVDPSINALNINIPSGGQVVLRNLDIEGNGTTLGLNGVNIISARSVRIEHSQIGFFSRSGILMSDSQPNSTLVVTDSQIYNNGGNGVTVAPPTVGSPNKAKILRTNIQENGCGVVAATFGMTNVFGTDCGTNSSASGILAGAAITTFDSSVTFNLGSGIFSRGASAFSRIGENEISGNAIGLRSQDSGQIISLTGNHVAGNGVDGAPPSTVTPV